MATLTCPSCAAAVLQDDLICFSCGANLPHPDAMDEPAPSPTVMQEYRRSGATALSLAPATCPECGSAIPDRAMLTCPQCEHRLPRTSGPISPVVLRLGFPTGNVDVPAGTSLVLGRDPGESLVAAAFFEYDNVSRRHATVAVTDAGEATIRDEHSTNGTFVNDDRVLPGTDVPLADGDRVRLGADLTAEVSLPQAGFDPAPFSQNGHQDRG
jgi:hypothetical protein